MRPDERDALERRLAQRERASLVLQLHDRLPRRIERERPVRGRPGNTVGRSGIDERLLEEPDDDLGTQQTPDSRIDRRLRHLTALHCVHQRLVRLIRLDVGEFAVDGRGERRPVQPVQRFIVKEDGEAEPSAVPHPALDRVRILRLGARPMFVARPGPAHSGRGALARPGPAVDQHRAAVTLPGRRTRDRRGATCGTMRPLVAWRRARSGSSRSAQSWSHYLAPS